MYQLFIANKNYSSWSLRPWILLSELQIPFAERLERFDGPNTAAKFRQFSPSGTVPCLHDGDTRVWDSLAIVEYLAERHEGVWPTDCLARAWARSASAEMHSGLSALRNRCSMSCGVRVRLTSIPEDLRKNIGRLNELWSEGLARFGGPFLAGDRFTAVDAFFCPVAFRVQTYDLKLEPAAAAYVARLLNLPSMRSWYESALGETTRDWPHEEELKDVGEVTQDLRAPAEQ